MQEGDILGCACDFLSAVGFSCGDCKAGVQPMSESEKNVDALTEPARGLPQAGEGDTADPKPRKLKLGVGVQG